MQLTSGNDENLEQCGFTQVFLERHMNIILLCFQIKQGILEILL